jgi:WD40 repeat protein
MQIENAHTGAIYDGDWKNDREFATCSADGLVKLWDLSSQTSKQIFKGHKGAVTQIKWDTAGTILASTGADMTVKVNDVI